MKLTKIVATIGPSTESVEHIEQLLQSGVNVIRFNCKHNDVEWHAEHINRVREVSSRLEIPAGVLVDLQGPEIRILTDGDRLELTEGELYHIAPSIETLQGPGFTVTHPDVLNYLEDDQLLIADDGFLRFNVLHQDGKTMVRSLQTATLKNRKTLNIPGGDFPFPVLTERDYQCLDMAAQIQAEYIALSFVRTADDVNALREQLQARNCRGMIISKIENQKAIENLDAILEATDGVMVARGDLGVELPIEQVPYYTRVMLKKCMELSKPVITATQMLESMIENPQPTRAEISDIATAAYDFSDAVMLSGESASGKYPIQAVNYMQRTLSFNETKLVEDTRGRYKFSIKDQTGALCGTAYNLLLRMQETEEPADGVIVFTKTGYTAKVLSNFKPRIPIFALSPSPEVVRTLTLYYAIHPYHLQADYADATRVEFEQIRAGIDFLIKKNVIPAGKKFICLHGDFWGVPGGVSILRVMTS